MSRATDAVSPDSTSFPPWWPFALWSVAALALSLRVAWAVLVPVDPVSDGAVYYRLARNLLAGHGYAFQPGEPTAYWPVGTSVLYAAVLSLGATHTWVTILNVAIGVASVVLTAVLSREWFGFRAAIAAGVVIAAWPGQIQFTTLIASELPFNLCWLGALYVASRKRLHPLLRSILVGVGLAAASYLRPVALLLPIVFAWIRIVGPDRARLLRVMGETALTFVVMGLLILPWSLRNTRSFGRPVLVSTNGGANLWMGNNPESDGGYMPLPESVGNLDEARRDAVLKDRAIRYIVEHPLAFVGRTLRKLGETHARETIGVAWNQPGLERTLGTGALRPLKVLSSGYWLVALGVALAGVIHVLRRVGPVRLVGHPTVALWAYFAGIHAVIVGGDRYHYPSVPLMAALAGVAAVSVVDVLTNLGSRAGRRRVDGGWSASRDD